MSALRDKILNADDRTSELVEVPEWGVTVEVRGMNGTQRAAYLTDTITADGTPDLARAYPTLLIQSCYDPETGTPVFEAADRDMLNSKSARATERLAKAAMRVSGLDAGAVEAGKAVLPSTPSAASTSS